MSLYVSLSVSYIINQKPDFLKYLKLFVHYCYHLHQEIPSALPLVLVVIAFLQVYLPWYEDCFYRTISHSKYFPLVFLHQHPSLLGSFLWKNTTQFLLTPALEIVWHIAVKYKSYSFQEPCYKKEWNNKTNNKQNEQSSVSTSLYAKVISRKDQFT